MRTKSETTMTEIIGVINDKFFSEKVVPTVQEIADEVGLTKGAISKYLTAMEERGLIIKNGSHYGIATQKMQKAMKNTQYLPIVGDVACGTPILAEQNIESYLTISGEFLGAGTYFVLRAKGDSMINAGINDGDYVVVTAKVSVFSVDNRTYDALLYSAHCEIKNDD